MEKWLEYAQLLWLNVMVNVEGQDVGGDFFSSDKLDMSPHFSILFSFLPGLGKLEETLPIDLPSLMVVCPPRLPTSSLSFLPPPLKPCDPMPEKGMLFL